MNPTTAQEKVQDDQLKRQIEKTDREMDERVYALYGITEKEKSLIDAIHHP